MQDFGFKYEIGDIVKVIGSIADNEQYDAQRWLVVSQHLDQCYGGMQRAYSCRGIESSGSVTLELLRFTEIEIEPSEAFKAREPRPSWRDVKAMAKDLTEDK